MYIQRGVDGGIMSLSETASIYAHDILILPVSATITFPECAIPPEYVSFQSISMLPPLPYMKLPESLFTLMARGISRRNFMIKASHSPLLVYTHPENSEKSTALEKHPPKYISPRAFPCIE